MITGTKPRPFLRVAMEKQFYLKGIGPDPIIGVARKTTPPPPPPPPPPRPPPEEVFMSYDNYV